MNFISKVFGSVATKKIMVEGILVPVIATVVGFEVQKALVKKEQKKILKAQESVVNTQAEQEEVIDINQLPE